MKRKKTGGRIRKYPIYHECQNCYRTFYDRHACKTRIPRFCSRKCAGVYLQVWRVCKQCKKEYNKYQNKDFCSMKCMAKYKHGKPLSQKHCEALSEAKRGKRIVCWHTKYGKMKKIVAKRISKALRGKKQLHNHNEKHHGWKGDKASYFSFHCWLNRNYGKADHCENIDCVYPRTNANGDILLKPKIFNWALIHGNEHGHHRERYKQLCCSCHKLYDMDKITL